MLASWLNISNTPFDYSIIKNENAINLAFSNNNGIYQKLYIDNKLYGYFAAINIDDSYVFTYFQPLIKNISTKNIIIQIKINIRSHCFYIFKIFHIIIKI